MRLLERWPVHRCYAPIRVIKVAAQLDGSSLAEVCRVQHLCKLSAFVGVTSGSVHALGVGYS